MRSSLALLAILFVCLSCGKVEPLDQKEARSSLRGDSDWCRMEEVRENHFLISRMRLVGPTSILLQEVEISPEAGPVYRSESLVSLSRVQRSSARTHTDYNLQKMLMENGLTHHPYLREVPNCFEASEALEVELDKFGTIIFYPCADYAADLKRE